MSIDFATNSNARCFGATMRLAVFVLLSLAGLMPPAVLAVEAFVKPEGGIEPTLELKKGDHIAIVGGTLAELTQHDGWLETMLVSRFPEYDFVIRDLGFSGDELALRLRSAGFGSPDDHLKRQQADVIFAMFGLSESFDGEAGVPGFKKDLTTFIKHTLSQQYNSHSPPRLVLYSPIAHEDIHNPNVPDGTESNSRLKLYVAAMQEVAAENHVPLVDLFTPSQAMFATAKQPLTINGIHLTNEGNKEIAKMIDQSLFGDAAAPAREPQRLDLIRQAVVDKNFYWFHRYRTTDGYSIYGGRADMAYVDKQTNREVMAREMEVLDIMAANRDRKVWAAARGTDLTVDDSNTPEFLTVITNKPGKLPGGKHLFLGGEEAIGKMTVAKGLKVSLFASEEQFPELINPVQMAFDTRGRLWVAAWPSYPHWKPKEEMNDKLLILEDTNGDGRADKVKVFADHLHNPTGFEFSNGGVYVAMAPDILFLKDTDGDDRADVRQAVLHGLDSADTHHTSNSFTLGPSGSLYFQEGTFHHTQVETPYGTERNVNAGVYRYDPRRMKFEVYVSFGFANPHGHVFDRWGQDIVTDGTGANPYDAALFSGHVDYPQKHRRPPQVYDPRTRPCPGIEILSSRHFPAEDQGNLLVANVIGMQGILQYKLGESGGSLVGKEVEPLLSSTDPNFRPCDLEIGPDGALWFCDWQNPVIGHLQHNLRDPSRDRIHGRVYRLTRDGQPLLTPPKIAGESVPKLLDLLKEPEDRVRYRARIELSGRDTKEVMAALEKWLASLDKNDPQFEHNQLEALWVCSQHNQPNAALLEQVLASKDFHARAAAVRVLADWRDRVSDSLARLKKLAADPEERVRLEAVRAASFYNVPEAMEVPAIASANPRSGYTKYVVGETTRTLDPYWKRAIASGQPIAMTTPAGRAYFMSAVKTDRLLKMPREEMVLEEILVRPGIKDSVRLDAASDMAKLHGQSQAAAMIAALEALDQRDEGGKGAQYDLARLLAAGDHAELVKHRPDFVKLATTAKQPLTRQLGLVTLIAIDGSADEAWALATTQRAGPTPLESLVDLLQAVPLIASAQARAGLYPRIEALLTEQPKTFTVGVFSDGDSLSTVRHEAMLALTHIRGQEAKTFGLLAKYVDNDAERPAAIRALQRIDRGSWPKDAAAPLVKTLLAALAKTPAQDRTGVDALATMEFADALASLLPADEAKKTRAELGELGVRVVRLGALLERMAYDKEALVAQAGKPVEFLIENSDTMPHNFVVVTPGAMQEVGELGEATALAADAVRRQYVPKSAKVLVHSAMIQPRETVRVSWAVPSAPGVYPYICTFPGHWRRMCGALYVVEDIDAYTANPEAYLAAHPLEVKDELLKDRRPRTEWKFDDLAAAVESMDSGRSYAGGKQSFQMANCVACHKLDNAGVALGPDLAKLDEKLKPVDILKDILEPSFRINEKFQTVSFELNSGKIITGLIVSENKQVIKVLENPLAKAEPIELDPTELEERFPTKTSIMPKGLLDKLSREEILDLVAFIASRGDEKNPLFQGGHEHCHEGHEAESDAAGEHEHQHQH